MPTPQQTPTPGPGTDPQGQARTSDSTSPGAPSAEPAKPIAIDSIDPATWGAILAVCGLDEKATPEDVLDVITSLVEKEGVDDGKPSSIAAAAGRAGLKVLDETTYLSLRAAAAEATQIKAAAEADERERIVAAAVQRGAITPGRRDHWLTLLAADPGMKDVLMSTPDELAVPLREVGHSASVDDDGQQTSWIR